MEDGNGRITAADMTIFAEGFYDYQRCEDAG